MQPENYLFNVFCQNCLQFWKGCHVSIVILTSLVTERNRYINTTTFS